MNRQTHQQRSYLLSVSGVKKRGFCHCSPTSQNIRMVHCEREIERPPHKLPVESKCVRRRGTVYSSGKDTIAAFCCDMGHTNNRTLLFQAK